MSYKRLPLLRKLWLENKNWKAFKSFGKVQRHKPANYFGNRSDGDLIVDSDVNIPNTQDGDMIVKQYSSLIINEGCTLTTQYRCRGLMIYVSGNCTINGILSMTNRGCKANPNVGTTDSYTPTAPSDGNPVSENGILLPMRTADGTDSLNAANFSGCGNAAVSVVSNHGPIDGDGTIFGVARVGGGDVDGVYEGYNNGSILFGNIGSCGGGATGGGNLISPSSSRGGNGMNGTCFSGGSAGGGGWTSVGGGTSNGLAGVMYGGAGGDCYRWDNIRPAGGGSGNPKGLGGLYNGIDGTGGLLILIVGGNLVISENAGSIQSKGSDGSSANSQRPTSGGGGGSGGGRILILHKGTITKGDNSVLASGGSGGNGYGGVNGSKGGTGGAGAITIANVL